MFLGTDCFFMKLTSGSPSIPANRGFTLIECAVGLVLVAVVVGALYTGITFGAQRTAGTRENLRATQILLEKVEQIRLYRWDQLVGTFDPDDLIDFDFDPEDPHTEADDIPPFVIPATFSVPFMPGATNKGDVVYTGTFSITNAPVSEVYSNELMQVSVTLAWQSRGKNHTRSIQTLFAKHGLQHNIPRN